MNPSLSLPPSDKDVLHAASIAVAAAAGTEESRFSALNVRAVALVSASSVVTALIGVFSKDFLGSTFAAVRPAVALCLTLTILSLIASVVVAIVGVLLPANRVAFGDNRITSNEPMLTTVAEVDEVIWNEYRQVLEVLLDRNRKKARALNSAYKLFAIAAGFAALSVLIVIGFSLTLSA